MIIALVGLHTLFLVDASQKAHIFALFFALVKWKIIFYEKVETLVSNVIFHDYAKKWGDYN
jgi:hypothetical protein